MQTISQLINALPYFKTLSTDRLATLAQQAVRIFFTPDQMIFSQDTEPAGLWVVETGRVKIFRANREGREHILRVVGPGESFNDIPALDRQPNAASAIALSEVAAWVLPPDALTAAIRANPDVAEAVVRTVAGRVRALVGQVEELALYSVTARLASYLLDHTDSLNAPGITRAIIAGRLATTPETVSRALRKLASAGAISFDRQDITILDASLLRNIAVGGELICQE